MIIAVIAEMEFVVKERVAYTTSPKQQVYFQPPNENENEFVNRIMKIYNGKPVEIIFFSGEIIKINPEYRVIEEWKIQR